MPTLHAVLIGINDYQTNPLAGCVNDALAIGRYFKKLCAAPINKGMEWQPNYLLAPEKDNNVAAGTPHHEPTRANIIAALQDAKNLLKDGDIFLLYYSGHGSTVFVPKVFEKIEEGLDLQTIVTTDSRKDPNVNNDILDKELAYLIADMLAPFAKPDGTQGVHLLAIMDCCFAGSNTRNTDQNTRSRMHSGGSYIDGKRDVLGFDPKGNSFYEPFKAGQTQVEWGGLKHARYVNLAAARDTEESKETQLTIGADGQKMQHGVFTYCLLNALEQSSANLSYHELIRRIETDVRSRVTNQIPMMEATNMADTDLFFLQNKFKTPEPEYIINRRTQSGQTEWYMNAGAIEGIVQGSGDKETTIKTKDGRSLKVVKVRSNESLLESDLLTDADANQQVWIDQMAFPVVKIGFAPDFKDESAQVKLLAAFKAEKANYLEWTAEADTAEFQVRYQKDGDGIQRYVLVRRGDVSPLFFQHDQASKFIGDANKIAKWDSISKISNPSTQIPRDHIKIHIEKKEGVFITPETLNDPNGWKPIQYDPQQAPTSIDPPSVLLQFGWDAQSEEPLQPAIKVKIENASDQNYWVGALFLRNDFGVKQWLEPKEVLGSLSLAIPWTSSGQTYDAIPIDLDDHYYDQGITEIKDYLLVFVAQKKFDLKDYIQDPIELSVTRSDGFRTPSVHKKDDWCTIKIPIQTTRSLRPQPISAKPQTFGGNIKIACQGDFMATAQWSNLARARRIVEKSAAENTKSASGRKTLLPPASLWDSVDSNESVFKKVYATSPDEHLSILELTNAKKPLAAGQYISITPGDPLADDETIVPFGYDPETGLYFPAGYTDEEGKVIITQLPPVTDGVIGADELDSLSEQRKKSLGGSIKLFFKKVVWAKLSGRHDYNKLALFYKNEDGTLSSTAYTGRKDHEADSIAAIQAATKDGQVLVLIHGIIGDTEGMIDAFYNLTDLHSRFKAILTFDYENLDTDIEKTARTLLTMLNDCGIPDQSVTIVAHSMGGLVSRYMIEHLDGGAAKIAKLVQLGTPNGGSEIGDFRKKMFNLIGMGINGVLKVKPYLSICTFIWKGLEKKLFHTLDQMQPSNDFIISLNKTDKTKPSVPYHLIAGDTTHIEAAFDDNDPAWQKIWACIKDRSPYIFVDYAIFSDEPNDMAVRLKSMRTLPWQAHESVFELPCDHMNYFTNAKSLEQLKKLL